MYPPIASGKRHQRREEKKLSLSVQRPLITNHHAKPRNQSVLVAQFAFPLNRTIRDGVYAE